MQVLDKQLCLVLNKNWLAISVRSIREAVICLCSQSDGHAPALALDIDMQVDENGEQVMVRCEPVTWDIWVTLPVRESDLYIGVSGGRKIRAPLIIVARNYSKIPLRRPRLSLGNIWLRDQGICQYTGRKLSRGQSNIDHVQPISRGGRDEWTNMVLSDKEINTIKGARTPEEAGLKLIREPKAPAPMPVSASITEVKHASWEPFLLKS